MQRGFPGEEEQLLEETPLLPRGGGRGFPEDGPDPLATSYGESLKQQPDQAGRIFNLRIKTGLPPALIERNLEAVEREAARQDFDADRFRRDSPLLASWLAENPELAAIAQDDLEPLGALERTLRIGGHSARALGAGTYRLIAGVPWAGVELAGDVLESLTGSPRLASYARTVRQASLGTAGDIRGAQAGAGETERAVYSGFESLGMSVPAAAAGLLTGGASTMLSVLGASVGLEEYGRAREEGASVPRSVLFGLNQAGIEVLTERIPAKLLFGDLAKRAGFFRTLVHQVGSEIPTEQAATFLQDLSTWTTLNPEAPVAQFLAERPSAAYQTLVATIVAAGGQTMLVSAIERVAGKSTSQLVLEELHAAAAASKTRERSPEALRAFLERATADGLTHVYAPAVAFTEYFQTKGEDPEALAAELTGNPDALRLARATDGDLAIPTSAYVSRIVGSGHESFFVNELRLSPDSMNARETQEAIAAEASAAPTEEPADPSADAREQIYQAMVGKLTATNRYTPQEVDAQARLYASVFGALGSRGHVDPAALFQQFEPTVVAEGRSADAAVSIDTGAGPGGLPASMARANETPAQREVRRAGHLEALTAVLLRDAQRLDPNVEPATVRAAVEQRLAVHEEQQAAAAESGEGEDLLQAIAGYGGIASKNRAGAYHNKGAEFERYAKEGRDIRGVTRGGRVKHQRGQRTWRGIPGVFNEEGSTPDEIVTALRQDQRFEHIEDINGLLEAVDRAMRSDAVLDTLPGTDELGALGITRGTRWWATDEAPAAEDVDGEGARYGPLQQPAPAPNEAGETAYFIGWQEGVEDIPAIALYNVIGGPSSGSTLSPTGLEEMGVPFLPAPELAGAVGSDVEFNTEELEQADRRAAYAEAVTKDPVVAANASVVPGDATKRPWQLSRAEYEALPIVYRGGGVEGRRFVFVSNSEALAKIHGAAAAYRLRPGARIYPDPEVMGMAADPDAMSGLESLNDEGAGSAVVGTEALLPVEYDDRTQPVVARPVPGDTEFRQSAPREARRAWLERRIIEARKKGKEDFEASRLLQDLRDEEADEILRARAAGQAQPPGTEFEQLAFHGSPHLFEKFSLDASSRAAGQGSSNFVVFDDALVQIVEFEQRNRPPGTPPQGTFNPSTRTIRLLKTADRSTFLHESAHLFLEVMADLAAAPDASEQLQGDMRTLLSSFQFEGDLAVWRALSNDARRDHHEEFARGFEKYLGDGKAPTPELQSLFARFRTWLLGVYRTLRRLNVELTPEVRAVMDRLVATDAAIAAAEADAGVVALFTDAAAAGVPEAEFEGYREQLQQASEQARARLQARLLRELEREQETWWQEQRAAVREEVAAEIYEQPVYRAIAAMRGEQPNGEPLPAGTPATPLSKDFLTAQFGRDILRKLPRPFLYSADSGLPPDTVAQIFGFQDGATLIGAILSAPPMDAAIDAVTDERMLERHGDLLRDPDALVEQAREAIAGEHRDVVIRAELRMLNKLRAAAAPSVRGATTEQRAEERAGQRAGASRLRTEMPDQATLERLATRQIAGMRLRDIRPDRFFAAARRHSRTATQAAAQQKFEEAVAAKQQELVNLALYREAVAAREAVDEARTAFDKMFKPDGPMAKRRNMDYVQAARAIAATYFWPERRLASAREALDVIRQHAEEDEYQLLEERVRAVTAAGTDLQALTFEAFTFMRETVDGLWTQSLREQQMLIDGELVDRNEAAAALDGRLDELGTATSQFFRTDTERTLTVLGFRAALRRVEHWVDYVDGKNQLGAFRRFIWNPISEATGQYRIDRRVYLQKFLALVKPIEATLVPGPIAAPELRYTFASRAALLHALLHTGNESNLHKLVRGYQWGELQEDGTVDASRWLAFRDRMFREGVLTKADMDVVQAVWDLNEELKAPAQQAHRDMFGTYFSEITAWPVETPVGSYRGGYVPAIVDPLRVARQEAYSEKSLTDGDNAHMFPTAGRGFTRARVEAYARPLLLDLRSLPGHHDKVLRFIHLEPRVRDVGRLLRTHRVSERINAYDPAVINEMLMPWLQRAATQRVSQPPRGRAARGIDAVFRTIRTRTGLNMMAGHVINALQQLTGLSVAALKVQPRYLRNALWRYIRDHKAAVEFVLESDPGFMGTRSTAATIEVQRNIEDLLLNPSNYEKVRDFGSKHGYILQQTTQNVVDHIVWLGAYEQATEADPDHGAAVRAAASAVRMTQGSFQAEDASRVESQSAFVRTFVMFYGYFNMLANINGNELAMVARDMGLRKGAGRALYVYTFGFMLTAVVGEAILKSLNGDWGDDDDDGYLDEAMSLFFGSQLRQLAAMVPGGQVAASVLNRFNDVTYDDRVSTSPAVTYLESATRAPSSLYQAMLDEGSKKQAVRDTLSAIGLLTGLPTGAIARPAGYLADVVDEREEPEGAADLVRGLVSGRRQAER